MSAALQFVSPPPGLDPHTSFVLEPVSDSDGLFSLRAVDDAEVRLFLVDPGGIVPDYEPVLSDDQAAQLGLESADEAQLFVVARVTKHGVGVNLLAPVVMNRRTGGAAQVILEGQDLPVRAILG